MSAVTVNRTTKETDIALTLDLAGGQVKVASGIGFFDHMLTALAVHAGWGLEVTCKGDLDVDGHHSVEDIGIVLGQAFAKAVDKAGIARYGTAFIPMDEALARCVVDISGRPFLVFRAELSAPMVGGFDTQLTQEFFRAFAMNAGITLHLELLYGTNAHHQIEGLFKACAHALAQALEVRQGGVLSTKGVLA
jgi:imidazoleglycerol-phosphate dehydratase